jgi:hypothetical protein
VKLQFECTEDGFFPIADCSSSYFICFDNEFYPAVNLDFSYLNFFSVISSFYDDFYFPFFVQKCPAGVFDPEVSACVGLDSVPECSGNLKS